MTKRVRSYDEDSFFLNLWHNFFGHPMDQLFDWVDYRITPDCSLWAKCECGQSVRFKIDPREKP